MAYVRKQWVDRSVQFPGRYAKSSETSTLVTLTESPGTVTQAGTPLNAANMNNIEDGIEERATWDVLRAAEREIAALKMVSTLKDKVDGASDYFFDDFSGVYSPLGSALEIDRTWNSSSAAISVGQTVIPLLNKFSTRFLVGQEVTIQHGTTESTRERRVITAVDPSNNTITISPGTANSYTAGALIYRSWMSKTRNAMKFQTARRFLPVDTSATNITGSKITGSATPGTSGNSVSSACSYDAEYVVEYVNSGGWNWLKRFGDKFETLFTVPYSIMTNTGTPTNGSYYRGFVISPDGVYLYILHGISNSDSYSQYITIVKRIGDTSYQYITRMDFSSSGSGVYSNVIAFSPKGTYVAMCMNGYQLRVYKLSGDIPTTICTVNTQPVSGPFINLVWSYDEQWVTFTYWSSSSMSSNGTWVNVYRQSGDVFTLQPASTVLLQGTSTYVGQKSFSKDGQYFCLMAGSAGSALYIYVYKISGTTWTLYKTLGDSGTNIYQTFCITPDSLYIYASARFSTGPFGRFTLTDTSTVSTTMNYNGGGVSTQFYFNFGTDPKGDIVYNTYDGYFANMSALDVLQVDIRYNAKNQSKPIRGIAAFIKRLSAPAGTVTATISATSTPAEVYAGMTKIIETIDAITALDTSTYVVPNGAALANVTLKLNFTRTATNQDTTITEITGALE
ncbi:hypothetical protein [Paenibacillus glycanilyticus]|uniref:hypothetical protein n=1 Tax=Paenibacillus glycanilyticus TaxID=126569 RepID=UPI000FDA9F6E|nr:hypothetical protein [Paenibacillus glycanilyticus]